MKMKLDIIEAEIKNRIPNVPMKRIYFSKANRTLLCVYTEGTRQSIRLFDEDYGLDFVATIDYKINPSFCFISSFETLEDMQGLGLGRCVYNMALAHADMLGATSVYGKLSPTNNIKGVSEFGEEGIDKEIEALKQIYTKLGNRLDISPDDSSIKFYSHWNNGDRIKHLSNEQLELLQEIVNSNKNRGLD